MPTNFELKRLKPKLDIVGKPENRVHLLTDSRAGTVGTVWSTPVYLQVQGHYRETYAVTHQ